MKYEELEKTLLALQESEGVKFKDLQRGGVGFRAVKRIHSGKNYRVLALFKYLESIAYVLEVNGEIIETIWHFGIFLSTLRQNQGLTLDDLHKKTGLSPQQLIAIEHGKNYTKTTLLKYIELFNLDFNVKYVLDVI